MTCVQSNWEIEFVFSPDVTPSVWLGSKHQLTNLNQILSHLCVPSTEAFLTTRSSLQPKTYLTSVTLLQPKTISPHLSPKFSASTRRKQQYFISFKTWLDPTLRWTPASRQVVLAASEVFVSLHKSFRLYLLLAVVVQGGGSEFTCCRGKKRAAGAGDIRPEDR